MTQLPKAVVTGASGLIGRALVRLLVDCGTEVTTVDTNPCADVGVRSVDANVSSRAALDPLLDSDTTVFHLAASANVGASVANPRHDFNNTFCTLFEVLESARASGSRVVFPSSASVFDQSAEPPFSETSRTRAVSPYAAAKLAGEAYCTAFHRSYGLDVRVARLFSVYGPEMRRLAIHDIIRKIQHNPAHVEILGDGKQIRDYLHATDAARGLFLIATAGKPGEDYNLASGVPVTLLELTQTIAKLMGYESIPITTTGASFPGDTSRWYADISKVRGLGFEPRIPLEAGLRETIEALAARPDEVAVG